jgi:predicted ATPase/transcriptional regulator with XRE-family HTH domain
MILVVVMDSFGSWVRRRRRALDLSQHELARQVSCARVTIQKIETGERRPSAQLAALLADRLAIPPDQQPMFLRAARSVLVAESLEPPHQMPIAPQSTRVVPTPVVDDPSATTNGVLPPVLTCLGRQRELEQISALLAEPSCRVITLTGLGGVGKTHLALTVATQTEAFPDGVRFVALDPLPAAELVPAAIASALGISLEPAADPLARIGVAVRQRHLLLVLDNAEHLLPGIAEQITRLSRVAPGLRFLVTSRERLRLQSEYLIELRGLTSPPDATSVSLQEYSAAALLLQQAARVRSELSLSEDDRHAIARICQIVHGLPLALVLAASWARLLPFPAIADQLARDLDPAGLAPRDLPARHHSLQAVFRHSWALLIPEVRHALAALAVFHGAFSATVAQEVGSVSLSALAALQDSSLLEVAATGYYALHPLVRHFAWEQLNQDKELQKRVRTRHAVHAARMLHDANDVSPASTPAVFSADGVTIADVRAAWGWVVEHRDLTLLDELCDGLVARFSHQGWLTEGVSVLDQALRALAGPAEAPAAVRQLARRLQIAQALCYQRLSLPVQAERLLQQVLASSRADDDRRAWADSLHGLGAVAWARGAYRQARQYVEEAVGCYQALSDTSAVVLEQSTVVGIYTDCGEYEAARVLGERLLAWAQASGDALLTGIVALRVSLVEYAQGDYGAAQARLEELLALAGAADQLYMTVHLRSQLGLVLAAQGANDTAERLLQEAVTQARVLNYPFGLALALNHLGAVLCRAGRYAHAEAILTEALSLCEAMDNRIGIAYALIQLGTIVRVGGDLVTAERLLQRSFMVSEAMAALPLVLDSLLGLAALVIQKGQISAAAHALVSILASPSTRALTRADAAQLYGQIEGAEKRIEPHGPMTYDDLVALARQFVVDWSEDQ